MKQTEIEKTVLVVDDDKNTRDGLEKALSDKYNVILAENGNSALDILRLGSIDVMLIDVKMPGMDGLTLLQKALGTDPNLICILLTAYGSVETAVEAMKKGAFDFLTKPVNLDHLDMLLERALRSKEMEMENEQLRKQLDDKFGLENIIGSSPRMKEVFEVIRQAAPTQATILIQGESGTGKELVAHAIHKLSQRAKGPFIPVHCAALAPTLLESELFGHEKGAFTGAVGRRIGRFEMADGGTLFLDEISEMEPSVQVKLLRVLEERRFERVGGEDSIEVDIRLVAATNKDLKKLVQEGKFREDLFFRLDVVNITLPPLRERSDDIPLLCNAFVKEYSAKNNKKIAGITAEAIDVLTSYSWPGNVRELRNTVEKMVVLAHGDKLTVKDIPSAIRETVVKTETSAGKSGLSMRFNNMSLDGIERQVIFEALRKRNYSRTDAAKDLGVSRRTLQRKLKEYKAKGLLPPEFDKSK